MSLRVKLYCLQEVTGTEAGVWADKGTGFVSVDDGCLIVREERDEHQTRQSWNGDCKDDDDEGMIGPQQPHTLLVSRVRMEDAYERQGESIIMWREAARQQPIRKEDASLARDGAVMAAVETDYALSFQDSIGCQAVWYAVMCSIS